MKTASDHHAAWAATVRAKKRARFALLAAPVLFATAEVWLFGGEIHGVDGAGLLMLLTMGAAMLGTAWVCATVRQYLRASFAPVLRRATTEAIALAVFVYIFGGGWGGYGLATIAATTGVLFGFWLSQNLLSD